MNGETPSRTLTAVGNLPGSAMVFLLACGLLWIVNSQLSNVVDHVANAAEAQKRAADAQERGAVAMEQIAASRVAETGEWADLIRAIQDNK